MRTILLTGFEPFGGDAINPSAEAVTRVAAEYDGPHRLVTDILPVTFAGSARRLPALIAQHSPAAIIATGLAGGSGRVAVERVGINLMDARTPDNDGHQPVDEPSEPAGPQARFATLPVKRLVGALEDAGIPAHASLSAGSFVCNHVLFTVLGAADGIPAGFVHLPWSASTAPAGAPSLPDDDLARALRICVDLVFQPELSATAGGSIW